MVPCRDLAMLCTFQLLAASENDKAKVPTTNDYCHGCSFGCISMSLFAWQTSLKVLQLKIS